MHMHMHMQIELKLKKYHIRMVNQINTIHVTFVINQALQEGVQEQDNYNDEVSIINKCNWKTT
jgi:hypothetical protein